LKKKNIVFIALSSILLSFGGFYAFNYYSETENVVIQTKSIAVENLGELESEATLIVKVAKDGGVPYVKWRESEEKVLEEYYTISNVEVNKIFKNTHTNNLKIGNNLKVFEFEVYDRDVLTGELLYYSDDGYKLMEREGEYLLFLRESTSHPGKYIIIGSHLGKYKYTTINDRKYGVKVDGEEILRYKEFAEAALNKYK
jgi:nitrogen regulatory protein PII-like uncharacterized protein